MRGVGFIAAVELVANKRAKFDPVGKVAAEAYRLAHQNGLMIRMSGDSLCFCPPLICTEEGGGQDPPVHADDGGA